MKDYAAFKLSELRKLAGSKAKSAGQPTTEIRQRWNKKQCLDFLNGTSRQPTPVIESNITPVNDNVPVVDEAVKVPLLVTNFVTEPLKNDTSADAPASDALTMQFSTFPYAGTSKATPISLSKQDFIKLFSEHHVRPKKDGKLFSPARFNGKRGNGNFISADGICFDFDYAQPSIGAALGLFAGTMIAYYSTHSHCWKCKEHKKKNDDGSMTIIPADTTYTPENQHFRLVIPLDRTVNAEEHERLVRGIMSIIPADQLKCIDKGCFEKDRPHYLPSCIPEHKQYAFTGFQDGEPLNVKQFLRLGSNPAPAKIVERIPALAPADKPQPAPEQVASRTYEYADPTTGEVFPLTTWAAQNPLFDIVNAINLQYRRGDPKDGKQHIQCPFEDEHTDQATDLATFAGNASPPDFTAFDVHCRHDRCTGRDRLEFVLSMLEKGWLSVDLLQPPASTTIETRRPHKVYYPTTDILAAPEWSILPPDVRRIALDLMSMCWAEIDGMIEDNDWKVALRLGIRETEWMPYRQTLDRTGWLIESNGRLTNGIVKKEFDNAQYAYMNAIISGGKGGRKSAANRK